MMFGSSNRHRRARAILVVGSLSLAAVACTDEGGSDTIVAEPHTEDTGDGGGLGLGTDQSRIRGTVDGGRVVGTLDGPADGPFTLHVPSAGGGNGAVITGVTVDGEAKEIVWDGGRSLSLEGPALTLPTGTWTVGSKLSFALDGAAIDLPEGSYTLTGPVAVGGADGLGESRDEVTFTAEPSATLTGTGSSSIELSTDGVLLGPGNVSLVGTFTAITADEPAESTTVELQGRSFELTFTSDDGDMAVEGVLEGATTR